jgi:thioesterase domain-containing protein
VARGYLNQPALTAERFVVQPSGARWYRTGDRCRWRADGQLDFLGRIDHQVKLRGFRIELGEIERTLAMHPAVAEAVVVARDERLVAYVVAASGGAQPALRDHLTATLPEYMVPAAFVWLDALPQTPNGKIDRAALPVPDPPRVEDGATAFGALEIELGHLWAEVAGAPASDPHASFFTSGGHSLLAVVLLKRIEDRFGQAVSLPSFFQRPTIDGLAEQLRGHVPRRPWSPLVAIQPRGTGVPLFCVHPALGSVARYDALARQLGTDRPFYALTSIGLERDQAPDTRVEAMAERYLEAVRGVQPAGPYLLGGHSFGGLVAFEMAQQLVRAGEHVAVLALLDTVAPGPAWQGDPADHEALGIAAFLREVDVPIDVDALRELGPDDQLQRCLDAMAAAGRIPAGLDLDQVRRMVTWRTRIVPGAYRHYVPQRYPGDVTLFRASEPLFDASMIDPFAGWTALSAQPIVEHRVPGDHYSMLRAPHLEILADQLGRCLGERDPQTPSRRTPHDHEHHRDHHRQ